MTPEGKPAQIRDNEPQSPGRRRFLRFLATGAVVTTGVVVGSIGLGDAFTNTRPRSRRILKEANTLIPPPTNEELDKAHEAVSEFSTDILTNTTDGDLDSIKNTVENHSESLEDAFQTLGRQEANLELNSQMTTKSGLGKQQNRNIAMILGGYLGGVFGGLITLVTTQTRETLQKQKQTSGQPVT